MKVGHHIESLSAALHAACLRDLPAITYQDRDWEAHWTYITSLTADEKLHYYAEEQRTGEMQGPMVTLTRRPAPDKCDVWMFPQSWGSTALGYDGMGGQAITSAHTTIVECCTTRAIAVYFGSGGRLAYLVQGRHCLDAVRKAVATQAMPSVRQAEAAGWLDSHEDESAEAC